jgi:hypothetical protein
MKTMLCLFNSSRYAVDPWLASGDYHVVSVDHSDTDHAVDTRGQWEHPRHTRLDVDLTKHSALYTVVSLLAEEELEYPSFVLSFAPCTDLAVSGAAHFARKLEHDPLCQQRAVEMAQLASRFGCPYIVENPVSVLATLWRKPDGYVHPWYFADQVPAGPHPEFPSHIPPMDLYNKKTGLWCGNGAVFPVQTWFREPPNKAFPGHVKLGGKSARTKYIRSLTPRGMAEAIFLANRAKNH